MSRHTLKKTKLGNRASPAMILVTLLLTVATVFILTSPVESAAVESNVQFIDHNGSTQYRDSVTILENDTDFGIIPYTLTGGWYLVRDNINLSDTITINGDVHLILENGSNLKVEGKNNYAGILVTGNNNLIIYAQSSDGAVMGALTAIGHTGAAGIGGGNGSAGGTITINGGSVTANGGQSGAGIGGGRVGGTGGTITINGGSVTANGGNGGAGIGGGQVGGTGGTITINGGSVTANGGQSGAGIGGGTGGAGGTITINGGSVTANGCHTIGGDAAGIGGAGTGAGGTIIITGGDVTANGGGAAAGIGGGVMNGGTIMIHGGTVKATGDYMGPGIGSGALSDITSTIIISGGDVTVIGGSVGAAGIGGGYYTDAGTILIHGKNTKITAEGGNGPIGAGMSAFGDTDNNVFVALTYGNFKGYGGAVIGNEVRFTADPASNGTVKAILPAPLNVAPFGNGTIDILTGIGTGTEAKSISVITTFGDLDGIFFKLDGGYDGPHLRTGTELMTPDAFVHFYKAFIPPKDYYITASSDSGSAVFPEGKITVEKNSNITFFFSAADGYRISSVTVDGIPLSQAQIDLGYCTFYDVNMNHTIDVKSTAGPAAKITLTINIAEGKGRAEYSVNGEPFTAYTSAADLPAGSNVIVRAYADPGYHFGKWETPAVQTASEISFSGVTSSLSLKVYFTDNDSSGHSGNGLLLRVLGIILLLILIGLLLWFVFFCRRRQYNVIKVESTAKIIGDDRVRRKKEYCFSIEGGYSGTVLYRIGEDGEWKTVTHGQDGEYVIPKGDITDNVTIEIH